MDALWGGADPFSNFPPNTYRTDSRGWNSQHLYLRSAIDQLRPNVIVEVGVWKGGSCIHMAKHLRDQSIDGVVLAVDTWLGSSEHWLRKTERGEIDYELGYPKLYHTFMSNVLAEKLESFVLPLPLDSINACNVLRAKSIKADIIHIDAGHDYVSVSNDIASWWNILRSPGLLIGDDYVADGRAWGDVKKAYDDFFAVTKHVSFDSSEVKCLIKK